MKRVGFDTNYDNMIIDGGTEISVYKYCKIDFCRKCDVIDGEDSI